MEFIYTRRYEYSFIILFIMLITIVGGIVTDIDNIRIFGLQF